MKTLLSLTLGLLLACPILASAQATNAAPSDNPPDGGAKHHHDMAFLTDAQKAELKTDRDAALAANPTLASQLKSVHEQMEQAHQSGDKPSKDLFEQMKSLQDQLDQAMIKIDPAVAPIIQEIKAHHPHHGPGDGGTPPPDSGT